MTRILLLVLLAVILWLVLDWLLRKGMNALGVDPSGPKRSGKGGPAPRGGAGPEPLVRCAACGSYVPSSRALPLVFPGSGKRPAGERPVACSEECLRTLRTESSP